MVNISYVKSVFLISILHALLFSLSAFAENKQEQSRYITVDANKLKALEEKTEMLEKRLREIESRAVLSEPELIVKQKKIWICENGHEHDEKFQGKCPFDGLKLDETFTYQREKVFRRQTISEKIAQVLAQDAKKAITIGISATGTIQDAIRLKGDKTEANGDLFGVGSMDIFFIAKPALYTTFFADIETIGGISPDQRINNISLLTSDVARLVNDKQVNVREAWLMTELFDQKLTLSGGMLDLTNYFDANMVANDETSQFITDTLVNNPFFAPPTNGAGVIGIYDLKTGLKLKAGIQRGENSIKNLAEQTYSVLEIEYFSHFGSLPEGHYRLWYKLNGDTKRENMAWGISADQKLTSSITFFTRLGYQFTTNAFNRDDYFLSGGFQFKTPYSFNIKDTWAIGAQHTNLATGIKESLVEGYYNFFITKNLTTSLHLQYLLDSNVGGINKSYLLPGMRVQFDF